MSPEIDLGVNFDDISELDKFVVVPGGTYEFRTSKVELVKCGPNAKNPGRPMAKWTFVVQDPESSRDCFISNYTVLPFMDASGEVSVEGCGGSTGLVATCKGVGVPWTGSSFNTDIYGGTSGTMEVIQKTRQVLEDGVYVNDPSGEKTNDIGKFIY